MRRYLRLLALALFSAACGFGGAFVAVEVVGVEGPVGPRGATGPVGPSPDTTFYTDALNALARRLQDHEARIGDLEPGLGDREPRLTTFGCGSWNGVEVVTRVEFVPLDSIDPIREVTDYVCLEE